MKRDDLSMRLIAATQLAREALAQSVRGHATHDVSDEAIARLASVIFSASLRYSSVEIALKEE